MGAELTPRTVQGDPKGFLRSLYDAAVAAAHPRTCVAPALGPRPSGRIVVLGAGKAAAAMAAEVERCWPGELEGLVVTAGGYSTPCSSIEVVEAAHPVPDERGARAAARILEMAAGAGAGDVVLCLISGGASALLALPARGVALADKRTITAALLKSGASIAEINCVRKHLSAIKGGRLAVAAAPATVVTLIISDVVGDDPAVIASGPTVADPTTCADALSILSRYGVTVGSHIQAGLASSAFETPKHLALPADVRIIARPADGLAAAADLARKHGMNIINLGDRCEGYARDAATTHADLVRRIVAGKEPVSRPCVILSGGELVVKVEGGGKGGPNTEFALCLGLHCEGLNAVWALAADTDGIDGAADAAGAVVGPDSLARARKLGHDPKAFLARSDSASFFAALGDLTKPGPTRTNINDFRAVLVLPETPPSG